MLNSAFYDWEYLHFIHVWLQFDPKGLIDNMSALFQEMTWCKAGREESIAWNNYVNWAIMLKQVKVTHLMEIQCVALVAITGTTILVPHL